MRTLTLATRQSPLALWQAHHVRASLLELEPNRDIRLLTMTTEGDRFLSAPLAQIGGKGLFVKEIERALLENQADIAVHSLKDLPSKIPDGLCLACVPEREDPRDVFIGHQVTRFEDLPLKSRVGTSSLRRACQLREKRPDLQIVSIRGNVQRRLEKVGVDGLGGVLLALAGLRRLKLEQRITQVLSVEEFLPAVGQGALAVECRADDIEVKEILFRLEHRPTRVAITAERALLSRLEGSCTIPLAGFAVVENDLIHLNALVGHPSGSPVIRSHGEGRSDDPEGLGYRTADHLVSLGAGEILRSL